MQRGQYRNRGGHRKGRGGGGGGGRGGQTTRLKGCFSDGIWYCNCAPRNIAEHFKVKKAGRNQGRWFYTCQLPEGQRCDFFLWDEDAKLREGAAVLNNSRSEPRDADVQEGWNAGRDAAPGRVRFADSSTRDESPPTPSPVLRRSANTGWKRNVQAAALDSDDEFGISGDDEVELASAADATLFETPAKAQKTGVYATPATTGKRSNRKLPWLVEEPVTPASTVKRTVVDYFATTPSKPPAHSSPAPTTPSTVDEPGTPRASTTMPIMPPSPSPTTRHKDALSNPADAQSSLTAEVLAELTSIPLPPEKLSSLRRILSKHDLRTQGVTKGRDISRLALKARDAKVVELEARIASLEAEREVDRGIIARLRGKEGRGGVRGGWGADADDDDDDDDDEL